MENFTLFLEVQNNEKPRIVLPELFKPFVGASKKIEGVQFGNVVFALHDAPKLLNYNQAVDYCRSCLIDGKQCSLLKSFDLTRKINLWDSHLNRYLVFFDLLNQALLASGGKTVLGYFYWVDMPVGYEKDYLWDHTRCLMRLQNGTIIFYDEKFMANVRPVLMLENV